MNLCRRFTVTTALFFGLAGSIVSQTGRGAASPETVQLTRRTPEELARMNAAAHVIHMNVLVLDETGKPVTGLEKADFRILAGGQPQALATFQPSSRPVRILLVLDAINNKAGAYADERKAVRKLLSQNGSVQPFPVSLIRIGPQGLTVEPAERETSLLQSVLESLPGPASQNESAPPRELTELPSIGRVATTATSSPNWSGSTTSNHTSPPPADTHPAAQNARFVESLNQLEKLADQQQNLSGRAVLIWLGPGWPLLDDARFLPDTAQIQDRYFDHLVGLSAELRAAEITLDAVASPKLLSDAALRPDYAHAWLAPVLSAAHISAGNLSLPALALLSGGRVVDNEKELAKAIAQCAADASDAYALTFISTPAEKPDEYRAIQVVVDRPGLTTRTLSGYYAEP